MAITLTGAGGLFVIQGKVGLVNKTVQAYQASFSTAFDVAVATFDGTSYRDVVADYSGAKFTYVAGPSAVVSPAGAKVTQNILLRMVKADAPQADDTDLTLALAELIHQMTVSVDSVNAQAVTLAATAHVSPANSGTGAIVLSTKRGDGLVEENMLAETIAIRCSGDAQTSTATSGAEPFAYTGDAAVDVWAYNWPRGSAAAGTINAIDGSLSINTNANVLSNSGFDEFTANLPTSWIAVAGVAGTDFKQNTITYYDAEASSLELVGGGTAPNLTQLFGAATTALGTTVTPRANVPYVLNYWVKADVVPAAGVLTVDLIDGSNTVIADDQSVNNTVAVTLSGITTSFVAHNAVFRLPRVLPSTIKLRVRASTGISAGTSIFIDRMALAPMTLLYPGGPRVAIFSGATPFVISDGWTLAVTNDRGGSSNGASWQCFYDRVFGMRQRGLLLPSNAAAGETIADSLLN